MKIEIPEGATHYEVVFSTEGPVDPEPPIDPEPPEPPEPPPELGEKPKYTKNVQLDTSYYAAFYDQFPGNQAYKRGQVFLKRSGTNAGVRVIFCSNISRKWRETPSRFVLYDKDGNIVYDKTEILPEAYPGTDKTWQKKIYRVRFDTTSLPDGYYIMDFPDMECQSTPVLIKNGTGPVDTPWIPVWTASYEFFKNDDKDYQVGWIPNSYDPPAVPMPERKFEKFYTAVPKEQLITQKLIPIPHMDVHAPSVDSDGDVTSANLQNYTYIDSYGGVDGVPPYALLDGPRGVGNFGGGYAIWMGRATFADEPDSPLAYTDYFLDGFRLVRRKIDGEITTISGWRSKDNVRPYHGDTDEERLEKFEYVGNLIGGAKKLHGAWGMFPRTATLTTDHSHPPIPEENNQVPHVQGVEFIVANSLGDQLQRHKFDPKAHNVPPDVTVIAEGRDIFATGEWEDNAIYTARRDNEVRMVALDGSGNNILLIEGPKWGYVTNNASGQKVIRSRLGDPITELPEDCRYSQHLLEQTEAEVHEWMADTYPGIAPDDPAYEDEFNAQMATRKLEYKHYRAYPPCVPEGMFVKGEYCYYGSICSGRTVRFHIPSVLADMQFPMDWEKHIEHVTNWETHTGTYRKYSAIGQLAGGSGPESAVTETQWMARAPHIRYGEADPDTGFMKEWEWRDMNFAKLAYDGACEGFAGRIVDVGAREGMYETRLRQPEDPVIDKAKYGRGKKKYSKQMYHMTVGPYGFRYHKSIPLPWGEDEDIDYFLECEGHKQ